MEDLDQRWRSVERSYVDHLSTLSAEQVSSSLAYTNFRGKPCTYPLWMILLHVINHQTYHRGQVTTLLRQLGAKATAVDLLVADDCGFLQAVTYLPG